MGCGYDGAANLKSNLWSRSLPFIVVVSLLVHVGCGGGNAGGNASGRGNGGITANISASSTTVDLGQSVTLTWSSANASSCLASSAPPESDWTALVATGGSATVTPAGFGGEVYSLTCTAPSGSFATGSASVTVNSAATAIVNPVNAGQVPSNFWATQNCSLNGSTITSLTVVNAATASTNGQAIWVGPEEAYGYNSSGPGGFQGNWNATTDGTGILIPDYNLSEACFSRINLPVSILNINGSTASASFNAELVDSTGATAACSFTLVPPSGNAPTLQTIGCN